MPVLLDLRPEGDADLVRCDVIPADAGGTGRAFGDLDWFGFLGRKGGFGAPADILGGVGVGDVLQFLADPEDDALAVGSADNGTVDFHETVDFGANELGFDGVQRVVAGTDDADLAAFDFLARAVGHQADVVPGETAFKFCESFGGNIARHEESVATALDPEFHFGDLAQANEAILVVADQLEVDVRGAHEATPLAGGVVGGGRGDGEFGGGIGRIGRIGRIGVFVVSGGFG